MKRASDIPNLTREQVLEAHKLSDAEARFLVSDYYWAQDSRKRADMQIRHIGDKDIPQLLKYTSENYAKTENQVRRGLKAYAESKQMGQWMMTQYGVAEVIAAGFLAHLTMQHVDKVMYETLLAQKMDKEEAREKSLVPTMTVGHWWSFAGLLPDRNWGKGEKRPWNADLKQVCYHAGECFKRVSGYEQAFYGRLYKVRKEMLEKRNEAGHNAERAKIFVTKSDDVKKTLAEGKLPAGNLDRQACNWVVKIFLSHLHALWFFHHYKEAPPKPFAIAHLGHAHEIRIPNTEMFPGFDAAYYGPRAEAAE